MKPFPPHFRTNKLQRGDESSIALIITLCVMSLLLVLVLAFASVTRVEIETATANRDIVASKFIAQAALERAIADLAAVYVGSNALTNTGISGTFSQITPSSRTIDVSGASTNYYTDIEHIMINPITGQGNTINGADGIIDYVALPNSFSNFTAGITPQWLGLKDTNGNLIGRVAFLSSGGSLCLNAVGNLDSNIDVNSGLTRNTRNQGVSPAEINLVAALVAMGWSAANATNDVREILNYRYGPDANPGTAGTDDNNNATVGASDKIDNDGDGSYDTAGEATDEPQEALAYSDQTNSTTITPVGDDRVFTDLKQLYQLTNFSAGMQGRFSANFTAVQQFFCTQSPVMMDANVVYLNSNTFLTNPNAMFEAITNRLNLVNAFSDYKTQQVQVAANIVSFHNTNSVAPFSTNWSGGYVVGVGEVPHMNEVAYQIVANVSTVVGAGPVTNLVVDLTGNLYTEVWYPYTNNFPRPSIAASYSADLVVTGAVAITPSATVTPNGFTNTIAGYTSTPFLTGFVAATTATITNSTQFRYTNLALVFGGQWSNNFTTPINIGLSNFNVGGIMKQTAVPNATLDYWPNYISTNGITFSNLALTNGLNGPAPQSKKVTGWVSFALNDPRVKPSNQTALAQYLEYAGITNSITVATTLGFRNPTNSLTPGVILSIFNPLATNTDDYAAAGGGITNKTFYVPKQGWWRSVTELGRVHRGYPWTTIDFKGNGKDGFLLDNFTAWSPTSATGATNYLHGRVNVNTDKSQFPVWAGLFAGMPLWTGTSWVDYTSAGIVTPMTKTSNLVDAMTAAKYPRYEALLSASYLSNMRGRYGSQWPVQASDEQKEWILDHTFELMSTRGSGNFFTIWAWGQALKGNAQDSSKKVTAAETLIVAMVKLDPTTTGANMKIVYFRYNPDLEFISSPFLDPGPED